jgi:transposase
LISATFLSLQKLFENDPDVQASFGTVPQISLPSAIMGFQHISRDVKLAAIRLYERDLLELDDIHDCCGMSLRTFYRILKLWRETGDVVKPKKTLRGRPRILDHDVIQYLLCLVQDNPDYFLDELLHLLKTNCFVSIHYMTIHRELERADISHKKLKHIAKERNEARRVDFVGRMAQYTPEQLGFLDEVSKDERTIGHQYGRSRKGTRAEKKQVFVRGRRVSTEALLTLNGIVAGTTVEGSMTKVMFLEYLELNIVSLPLISTFSQANSFMQLPKCSAFPGPLSILIMDNAKIHHREEIVDLIEGFGMTRCFAAYQ